MTADDPARPVRADRFLVERGYFPSRALARSAIESGLVTVNGEALTKASREIPAGADIVASAPHDYVSRGALKLEAALKHFGFSPEGRTCLDIGASTGGFTEVLLRQGAGRVYAVDVGHGQLHGKIRADARVVSLEKTDARALTTAFIPEPVECLAADVSFISLKRVLPPVLPLLAPHAWLVALIKPQFEAGRQAVKKGVVRDPDVHRRVCDDILRFVGELAFEVKGVIPSPIPGGEGNREFLLGAVRR
ncbi:MAG: TlyA family RNA methyltransferase [Methylobacteriaceae bacterium]|nr:TlyA family RNA methyltransferase [Methylobacteriaceae bacterium]